MHVRTGDAHARAHISSVGVSTGGGALAAAAGSGGPISAGGAGGGSDLRLTQELVAAKVAAEAANRRAEMMEADRDRVRRSLDEAQVGMVGFGANQRVDKHTRECVQAEYGCLHGAFMFARCG